MNPAHAMKRALQFAGVLLLLAPAAHVWAGQKPESDPLTQDQVEQVREVADQPVERIKLYIKFVEQRTSEIHQYVAHPHGQHPNMELHNLFEEFTRLADELQDNLDAYADQHADLRKPLKEVIEHSAKWPAILNEPQPSAEYDFARKTALDAALSTNDQAKKLLKEQEEYFAVHKPPKQP
jgi:exonuclease VII large subunit